MNIDLAIVIGYSKDSLQSREKMRAIMRDLYPNSTLEMNVLLSVYESGIPQIIRNNKSISNAQYTSYIQKIIDAYGIHEKYVIEGLNAWIDYCIGSGAVQNLQLTYTPSKTKIQNNTYSFPDMGLNPKESIAFSSPNISCYPIKNQVSGDQSDYDIVDLGNGQIEIIKFKGFEEKTMIIPNKIQGKNVIGIGKEAYLGCKMVEKIIISEGIKYIEDRAFYRCSELSEVVFPDSLERIGTKPSKNDHLYKLCADNNGAFYNTALQKLIFPSNLTFIGAGSFNKCDSLIKITCSDSLKTIEAKAFYKCSKLKTVETNEGLESIGEEAFSWCRSLTEILLPSTLKSIEQRVFFLVGSNFTIYCYKGSVGLDYARRNGIRVRDASTIIKTSAVTVNHSTTQFVNSSQNIQYNLAANPVSDKASYYDVTELGNGQIEITKYKGPRKNALALVVPNNIQGMNVVGIGKDAYRNCNGVRKIIISEGIRYIEDRAFYSCSELSEVVFPSSLERIGTKSSGKDHMFGISPLDGAFCYTAIKSIVFPSSLKSIGIGSFFRCGSLSSIAFPSNLETIDISAFEACKSLKNISLPRRLRNIEANAFHYCTCLDTVRLSEGLQVIGANAFRNCSALRKIIIPNSVKLIGNDAFLFACSGFTIYCYNGSVGLDYALKNGFKAKDASKI